MSAAIKQLEGQLGVALLQRTGRRIALTPAGELLLRRGQEWLAHRGRGRRRGEPARHRDLRAVAPRPHAHGPLRSRPRADGRLRKRRPGRDDLLSEDTTGSLLRDVAQGRLDLAVTFCAPDSPEGVVLKLVREEAALVHLSSEHPLAARRELQLEDLAGGSILVSAGPDSSGFTERVLSAFSQAGIAPHTRVDPYPDLGLQAVREGLGVVIYSRSAFPPKLAGSAFVALRPHLGLPFHLAARKGETDTAVRAVLAIADAVRDHPT